MTEAVMTVHTSKILPTVSDISISEPYYIILYLSINRMTNNREREREYSVQFQEPY